MLHAFHHPLPAHTVQVIMAGGDDEVTPSALIEWVLPVLSSQPGGQWLACEISSASRGCLTTRLRTGATPPHLSLCCSVDRARARQVRCLLPFPPPATLILLRDHAAQVMTLLDGMARWLNIFETDDPALEPIMTMLDAVDEWNPMAASA